MTKTNVMTNSEIKKGAKFETNVISTSPVWNMRKLNKIATGKDQDAKEVEGFSRDYLKELYNRLDEAFNAGGFWWNSIIARQGFCVTAARPVTFAEGDENNDDVKGLYVAKGEVLLTEVIDGQLYTLKAAAVWSFANIISSASLWLKFAEARAKAANNLYSWQKAKNEAKAKAKAEKAKEAKKARKEEAKLQELAKRAKDWNNKVKTRTAKKDGSKEAAAA